MRVLAIDPGRKRIGVAISDELQMVARPLPAIQARGRNADAAALAALVRAEGVGQVVVGLPLPLHGTAGPQAGRVQKFGDYLATQLAVPLTYWDERFTTVEAGRLLSQAGIPPRKQRDHIDSAAAAVLLQSYLDAHAPRADVSRDHEVVP
ncbi:MAG TPA: Holliday junction resolvase RuvX [Chloroflexia bacterium]|nr:Holliday junction resolvase RuvX [Chloroflexia bacterium]